MHIYIYIYVERERDMYQPDISRMARHWKGYAQAPQELHRLGSSEAADALDCC